MRERWARRWLENGGPENWIKRLEAMGARGYESGLGQRLEWFWGIRHVVVHRAGIVERDYATRHAIDPSTVGTRINVKFDDFENLVSLTGTFVDVTDQHFLARYPGLAAIAD